MSIFRTLEISASGLTAQRLRMDVIANNVANVNSTRGPDGRPFRAQEVVLEERGEAWPAPAGGVRVRGIYAREDPYRMVYDPNHPDADEEGYVAFPNVNVVSEMSRLIEASRAYEANLVVMDATKSAFLKALELGRA